MSFSHDIPTHLSVEDRLIGGLTARQLVLLASGVFCAIGALRQPHLALAPRLSEGVLALALTGLLVFVRPRGRPLLAWARVATVWAMGKHTVGWAARSVPGSAASAWEEPLSPPPHLAALLRPAVPNCVVTAQPPRTARRRPAAQEQPFLPTAVADDMVTFSDGRCCAVLECSGAPTALMDAAALRAVHAAYHAFLVGLSFPLQMLVCARPIDLRAYSAARETRLAGLFPALRRLESADAAFMRREAHGLGLLDRHVYVVIPAPERTGPSGTPRQPFALWRHRGAARWPAAAGPDDVRRALQERCEQVMVGLSTAGVHAWRLATPDLLDLWYHLLCPRSARLQPLDRCDFDHAAAADALHVTNHPSGEGDDHA